MALKLTGARKNQRLDLRRNGTCANKWLRRGSASVVRWFAYIPRFVSVAVGQIDDISPFTSSDASKSPPKTKEGRHRRHLPSKGGTEGTDKGREAPKAPTKQGRHRRHRQRKGGTEATDQAREAPKAQTKEGSHRRHAVQCSAVAVIVVCELEFCSVSLFPLRDTTLN